MSKISRNLKNTCFYLTKHRPHVFTDTVFAIIYTTAKVIIKIA